MCLVFAAGFAGNCSYLDKALYAQAAGARVVIVVSDEEALLRAGSQPR
jgi:hypothetical protein